MEKDEWYSSDTLVFVQSDHSSSCLGQEPCVFSERAGVCSG
jgi:hypothetical protein